MAKESLFQKKPCQLESSPDSKRMSETQGGAFPWSWVTVPTWGGHLSETDEGLSSSFPCDLSGRERKLTNKTWNVYLPPMWNRLPLSLAVTRGRNGTPLSRNAQVGLACLCCPLSINWQLLPGAQTDTGERPVACPTSSSREMPLYSMPTLSYTGKPFYFSFQAPSKYCVYERVILFVECKPPGWFLTVSPRYWECA